MVRPPVGPRTSSIVAALLALPVFVGPAAAARPPETGVSPAGEVLGAALITLVVGGGLLAFAPEYTERTTQRIHDLPGVTFIYGLGLVVLTIIVVALLAITVVGLLAVIPIIIGLIVVGELGYLAAGRAVTDNWGVALLVAMGCSVIVAGVPILGSLLGLILSSMGLGAAYLGYRDGGI